MNSIKVSWYTLFIFFGFLVAIVGMVSLSNLRSKPSTTALASQPSAALPTPSVVPGGMPLQLVTHDVARLARVNEADVTIIKQEQSQWTGGNLGCSSASGTISPITGYLIIAVAGDEQFEYHTDMNDNISLCRTIQIER